MELVFWIPVISGILQAEESFSLIPNSTTEIRIPLHGGGGGYILQQQHLRETLFWEMINMSVLDEDQP